MAREPRHIQDYGQANTTTVAYWGYASRVLPCTNDAGSCAYLDVVYNAHVAGMLYSGILWATILGVLLVWAVLHYSLGSSSVPPLPTNSAKSAAEEPLAGRSRRRTGGSQKLQRALSAWSTQVLLREAPLGRVFGRTTRLQLLILAVLAGYLAVWSFVGIVYDTWTTPVKKLPGVYNTRTSLGPWADRLGVLAYALTPLSVLLSSRESVLSLLTGVPYQSFGFLHRWLGYLMCVQAALHTVGWTVIEARLYQPQPRVGAAWIAETYMVWGVVAVVLLALLVLLSTSWAVRRTGYEFFRKAHYVLAAVYMGACWAHWAKLRCFLLPSLLFWAADRLARLLRTALLHYRPLPEGGGLGFRAVPARLCLFPDPEAGDVVRLDLEHNQDEWRLGQHFYLCFADLSIWQSHPFTPLNWPQLGRGRVQHAYLVRARAGETRKLAVLAAQTLLAVDAAAEATTPVILTGPYGEDNSRHVTSPAADKNNILCICGGTGIAYVLPVLLAMAGGSTAVGSSYSERIVELVWVMRYADNVEWVRRELDQLQRASESESCNFRLRIRLIHTRCRSPTGETETPGSSDDEKAPERPTNACCSCPADPPASLDVQVGGDASSSDATARHPDLAAAVSDFVDSTISGPTVVFASGPGGMISDLRTAVACCASGSKVWKGDARYDVRLVCDDRLEWQ